jgi:hypothetical protein
MVLMRPFVPFSEDDRTQLLSAFMAARMDGDNYGDLMVYEMPSVDRPDGPGIASATIGADETVSELENLLGRGGSEVRYGNMLLVPIDDALLYVQPFYVVSAGESRQLPQLQRVIAVFDDDVVIEDTLAEALTLLFGEEAATQERPDEPPPGAGGEPDEPGTTSGTVSEQAAVLLDEANDLFAEADAALEGGDIGEYQDKTEEAREKVSEAIDLLQGGAGADGSSDDAEAEPDADAGDAGADSATSPPTTIALRAVTPRP